MKDCFGFYIGDKSLKEKEKVIEQAAMEFEDPVFISNDGDSHDSR